MLSFFELPWIKDCIAWNLFSSNFLLWGKQCLTLAWTPENQTKGQSDRKWERQTVVGTGICIIVQPFTTKDSLLAVDINTWNVMLLGTANNQLAINPKDGKVCPYKTFSALSVSFMVLQYMLWPAHLQRTICLHRREHFPVLDSPSCAKDEDYACWYCVARCTHCMRAAGGMAWRWSLQVF